MAHVSLASVLIGAATAVAGPPVETDDPFTPGTGRWEIAYASEFESHGNHWELQPQADINRGIGDNIQLKLKPRLVITRSPEQVTLAGAGNIQAGIKWRILDDSLRGIALSVYPQLDVNPPGDSVRRNLVDRGTDFQLPLEVARYLGDTLVYAELGYTWRELRPNRWVAGVAGEWKLNQRLDIVAELRRVAERDWRDAELATRIGMKWRIGEQWTLLA